MINAPNALNLALANAAANAPKGEPLYLENLDVIANPSQEDTDYVVMPRAPQYNPDDVSFKPRAPQPTPSDVAANHEEWLKKAESNAINSSIHHLSVLMQGVKDDVHHIINMIQTAAQSMPQEPTLNHRSLEEWPDTTLLNELVNRENDLMPFYYELLKRIGSPELQKLVMSSMQGKNASMVTLAQLCAALGSMVQPQPTATAPAPQPQYSGQSTEEYRQDYPATIPPMPLTYNPYFKEK